MIISTRYNFLAWLRASGIAVSAEYMGYNYYAFGNLFSNQKSETILTGAPSINAFTFFTTSVISRERDSYAAHAM